MQFKKFIKIIIWGALGLTIICLFLYINLPYIVASQIQRRLPQFLNPNEVEFNIQKLGFSNTFVSKIRISKGISIDSVNIDYDIKGMSSIHLSKVTISGLRVQASLDENNQIKIPGLKFPDTSKDKTKPPDLSFLSFLPEKIVLQNAKLILHVSDKEVLIPFDVLSAISSKDEKIVAQTRLYPFGEKINSLVTYDIKKGIEFFRVEGKAFDLDHINPFITQKIKGVQLKGPVDFNLESASPQKKWKISISQLGFLYPFKTIIKDISATLLMDHQKISASGSFGLSHSLMPAIYMNYGLTLDLDTDKYFDLKLENIGTENVKIAYESNLANIKKPELTVELHGTPEKSKGKIILKLKEGRIKYQKESLVFADAKISSDIVTDFTDHGNGLTSKLALTVNNMAIKSDLVDSTFPFAGVSGILSLDRNNRPSCNIILKASEGSITSTEFKTNASGINIEVPIRYPNFGKKILYGKYSIPTISYDNRYIFSTSGKIFQTDSKDFQVNGDGIFKTLPDLKAQFKSIVGFENGLRASVDFKTTPVKLNYSDIEKLIPQLSQNADIDLTASATGNAEFINHHLKTSMHLNINDGKIHMPDTDFTATGINTKVDLNDLLVLKSFPGQMLTIDSIQVNKIKINDAKVRFTIENADSFLIENIRFKWCKGLVSTESIRFPQKSSLYALTFYCDRLEMVQLLKQMGAFQAEGSGTLNGRIPVVYSDGNISFDNGFLFSTPGSGGKVVIENTDRLTAGIPMDNPQFAQLDLAQEALKNFDYQWAKLVFNTFEDTLDVKMELNGKPSKVLPFEYRKEFGGFVRVDASSPGSHFQGIQLDINLKLPFNEVMKFGNKLKSILN